MGASSSKTTATPAASTTATATATTTTTTITTPEEMARMVDARLPLESGQAEVQDHLVSTDLQTTHQSEPSPVPQLLWNKGNQNIPPFFLLPVLGGVVTESAAGVVANQVTASLPVRLISVTELHSPGLLPGLTQRTSRSPTYRQPFISKQGGTDESSMEPVMAEKVALAVMDYLNKEAYEHRLLDIIQGYCEDTPTSAKVTKVTSRDISFHFTAWVYGEQVPKDLTVALPNAPVTTMAQVQAALKEMVEIAEQKKQETLDEMSYLVDQHRDSKKATK